METLAEVKSMFTAQAEWKAERLGKFSSSELHRLMKGGKRDMTDAELKQAKEEKSRKTTVETLFGDGAITYINEKIAEIITGESKDSISTLNALEWGAANENDSVLSLEQYLGKSIEYYGVANPKFFLYNSVSGGSPDGVIAGEAVVEAKCPYVSSNHIEYLLVHKHNEGAVYETLWLKQNHFDYYIQTQFNMMCVSISTGTPIKKAYFTSYDPRTIDHQHRLAVLNINADEDIQMDIAYRIDEASKIIKKQLAILL